MNNFPVAARLVVALLLAVAVPAVGQAPESAWTVDLTGNLQAEVNPDSVAPTTLTVAVTGSMFACLQERTLVVSLQADGGEPGVILELPAKVNFTIPQGEHVTSEWSSESDIDARLLVSRLAEQGKSVSWNVTASAAASDVDCLPAGPDAQVSLQLTTKIAIVQVAEEEIHHPSHEEHGGFDAYLQAGESFSFTFKDAGIYPYHDHLDPKRKGSVNVVEGTDAPATAAVSITDKGYEPANATIRKGGTVTWTNSHNQTRTVSMDELHGVEETDMHDHDDHEEGKKSPAVAPAGLILAVAVALLVQGRRR